MSLAIVWTVVGEGWEITQGYFINTDRRMQWQREWRRKD